jgi:hypothetical protein
MIITVSDRIYKIFHVDPVSLLRNIPPPVLSILSLTGLAASVNVAALAGDFDATRPV